MGPPKGSPVTISGTDISHTTGRQLPLCCLTEQAQAMQRFILNLCGAAMMWYRRKSSPLSYVYSSVALSLIIEPH